MLYDLVFLIIIDQRTRVPVVCHKIVVVLAIAIVLGDQLENVNPRVLLKEDERLHVTLFQRLMK